ncbi:MAG: TolC family protein [Bacteroidia bacterium]
MKKSSALLIFLFCFFSGSMWAQQPMTLKQLGDSLLENNYALRLVRIQEEQAGVLNTPGAAGFYPSVVLNGQQQNSAFNTRQEFFNGDVREANSALNQSVNVGVRLDWTLFNGFYVQSQKTELELNERLAEVNTVLQMESELYTAASLYFEIIARQSLLASLDSALYFSHLRVELAKTQLEVGKGSRLEYLQSMLDLSADSSRWMQEKTALVNLHTQLKQQLGMDPKAEVRLDDTVYSLAPLVYENLRSEVIAQNNQIKAIKIRELTAVNAIKKAQSQRYPRVSLYSEYSFVSSQNAVGILKTNRSLGPAAGVGLSYTLFNGSQVNRDIRIARLQQEEARVSLEKGYYDLEVKLLQEYENYLLQQKLLAFELDNVRMSRENVQLARIQLRLGSINAFQFRDVQLVGLEAESRYAQALFALKESELNLMLLSGGLIRYFNGAN